MFAMLLWVEWISFCMRAQSPLFKFIFKVKIQSLQNANFIIIIILALLLYRIYMCICLDSTENSSDNCLNEWHYEKYCTRETGIFNQNLMRKNSWYFKLAFHFICAKVLFIGAIYFGIGKILRIEKWKVKKDLKRLSALFLPLPPLNQWPFSASSSSAFSFACKT